MKAPIVIAISLAILAGSPEARALCIYGGRHFTKSKGDHDFGGRMYAKTTMADEFQDSALVVKGTVLSSRNIGLNPPNENGWGTVYSVRIDRTFKGKAPPIILDYTDRDSGGFYLGEGGDGPEYLLFLNPLEHDYWASKFAPGAYEVNYSCGQSRPWRQVSPLDANKLDALAAQPSKKAKKSN